MEERDRRGRKREGNKLAETHIGIFIARKKKGRRTLGDQLNQSLQTKDSFI